MKRILLNRWVIGILAVTGVLLALQYLVPTGEHEEISTSRMIEYIESGEVSEITFIDGDQVIEATLDERRRARGRQRGHGLLADRHPGRDRGRRRGAGTGRRDRDVHHRDRAAERHRLDPGDVPADRADRAGVPLADEQHAGRRWPRRHAVRQVQGQADHQGHAEDDVLRRRRLQRGDRGARRDQGVPAGARQVPGRGRQDPQGRAALRPPGHRQDAARPRGRGRGGRAVLLHLRLRLRRDVRRCRRQPGPRPVRAGQGERSRDRLHRRDRRRRPPPRRRHGRRSRRARADPQPAAGRDGRLRRARRRDPDRRDQPSRRPRPGAAASRPLRPPDRGRRPRPRRAPPDPQGPLPRQADGRRTSTSRASRDVRRGSPAPTWPTCSTRPRCSPPGRARS